VTDIITTILAIVAAVSFWLEYKNGEKVKQAELIMELNHQFISDSDLSLVEWELEKYYLRHREAKQSGKDVQELELGIDFGIEARERQRLVNYLVHLEGIATLVNEGILHLEAITNLMAYRYFIAVNNPIVQEKELIPYQDYYQGCFMVYKNWSETLGEGKVPLAEYDLLKQKGLTNLDKRRRNK